MGKYIFSFNSLAPYPTEDLWILLGAKPKAPPPVSSIPHQLEQWIVVGKHMHKSILFACTWLMIFHLRTNVVYWIKRTFLP